MSKQTLGQPQSQKVRRCRGREIPSRGAQPGRRSWTVERLMFEKDILRLTLGPSRNSLQRRDYVNSHTVVPLDCLHKTPYKE